MKALLIVSAAIETAIGMALLLSPSMPVALLLGASLDAPGGMVAARIAGAALLSLGIACWLARNNQHGRTVAGLVAALLLYNVLAVAVLVHASFGLGLSGFGIWPAAGLHTTLAIWCVACLRLKQ